MKDGPQNVEHWVKTGLRPFVDSMPPAGPFDEDSAANEVIAEIVGRSNV